VDVDVVVIVDVDLDGDGDVNVNTTGPRAPCSLTCDGGRGRAPGTSVCTRVGGRELLLHVLEFRRFRLSYVGQVHVAITIKVHVHVHDRVNDHVNVGAGRG
jgi:hypothetical protein